MHKFKILSFLLMLFALTGLSGNVSYAYAGSFKLTAASRIGADDIKADARNSVKLPVSVTVTNDGTEALSPGDQGYEIYLYRTASSYGTNAEKIVTCGLPEPLGVGETKQMNVEFSFSASLGSGNYFFIYDPAGNYRSLSYIKIVEYKPELTLDRAQTTAYEYIPLDFGYTFNGGEPLTLTLKNTGIARLTGLKCDVSDGFSVANIGDIDPEGSLDLSVSLSARTPGWYEGTLVISAPNVESKTIAVRGKILDPEQWNEGFEDPSLPGSFIAEDYWDVASTPAILVSPGNSSWATHTNQYSYAVTGLISPRVEVREGDSPLEFFAGRKGGRYDTYSQLKVSYSPDRETWTDLMDIQDNSSNSPFGNEMISGDNVNLFKRFQVTLPQGEWYLKFEGKYINIAQISGYRPAQIDHDIMHVGHSIPLSGTVNNPYEAVLTLKNMNIAPETDYTVTLYADGEAVAEAEAEEFEAGAEKDFSLVFTPHAEGMVKIKAEFRAGDYTYTTEEVDVTIKPEVAREEKQIGTPSPSYTSNYLPINAYYRFGESQFKYTAEQLDIPVGTNIVSMAFQGRILSHSAATDVNVEYEVYLTENGTASFTSPYSLMPYEEMTKVGHGTQFYAKNETTENNLDNRIFEVVFDTPFVYQGGDLTVAFNSACGQGQSKNNVTFALFNVSGQAIERHNDNDIEQGTLGSSRLPVIIIGTQRATAVVSGVVTAEDAPVEGARVRFTSGDVYYEATTDAEGKYSVEIMQLDKKYSVAASLENYAYAEDEEREFTEGETTVDIVLTKVEASEPAVILVSGKVTDIAAQPLEAATVDFFCGERAEGPAVTDNDGRYSISIENPGEEPWAITASSKGYVISSVSQILSEDNCEFDFILERDGSDSVDAVCIAEGMRIGIEGNIVTVYSDKEREISIYTLDGKIVCSRRLSKGRNEVATLAKGIYLIEGRKLLLR